MNPDPIQEYRVWKKGNQHTDYGAETAVSYYWFPTTDDMVALLTRPKSNYKDLDPFTIMPEDANWFGTRDMPQAIKYFRFGWPELTESIFVEDAALSIPRPIEDDFKTHHDMTGGCVDIGVFASGQPECMMQFEPNRKQKKTVKLLINVSASGSMGTNSIKNRGKVIIGIVDWLERSGYRVRLDICDSIGGWRTDPETKDRRVVWYLAFCAKDFSQPLDIPRLSFMAASRSMLRRVFFGIEAVSTEFASIWGPHDYGSVARVCDAIKEDYDYIFDYTTPVTIETAVECINYIVDGTNTSERPDDINQLGEWMTSTDPEEMDLSGLAEFEEKQEYGIEDNDDLEDLAPTTTAQQLAEHDDPFIWLTGYTYDNKPYKYAIRRKQ